MKSCLCVAVLCLLALSSFAEEQGALLDIPDGKIYYEIVGAGAKGTPLVIVNGGPGFDHAYLHTGDAVWNALAADRPLVFYDQRGNGKSSELKPDQSCTLADQIADLDAVIRHISPEPVDLLGHSWGGYLVMAYAARHPDRIRRLIICDSAAPKWGDTIFLFKDVFPEGVERQQAVTFAETLGDADALKADLNEYFTMLFYSRENTERFLKLTDKYKYNHRINQTLNADLGRFDLNPELPKFKFPTLVITGRYDMNVAPSVAYRIHKSIPGSKFVVFERSGHLPFMEEPDSFAQAIRDFLSAR